MKKRKKLGNILVESGVITKDQYRQAAQNKKKGQKIGDVLVAQGFITEKQLIKTLEVQLSIPYVSLYKYTIKKSVLTHASHEFAQKNMIMPLKVEGDTLVIAMHDPMNYYVIDNLELATGLTIKPVIATRDDILFAINKYYGRQAASDTSQPTEKMDESVVQLFNQILTTAVQLKASDIHLDPEESYVGIRYRIDGQLRKDRKIAKDMHGPLIARIKILAELDITQTRAPQDGRFDTSVGPSSIDLRVACLPTVNGEKIVIRILDLSDATRKISDLGFSKSNRAAYTQLLKRPSGLILLTGPTGSGKSSTLYASVRQLNKENVNIMTVEDPVELQMEGVNQVQVNSDSGLTFAAGLRSILRQDPDVIMIGEIRDKETAEIAIRSALTGHLVFSTLHTNSAVDAVPRLVDMGIEPYLAASSIKGVVAQRLVRHICMDCRKKRRPTAFEKKVFEDREQNIDVIYEATGCDSCHHTGYRGRFAVHEVITTDDKMKQALLQDGSSADLHTHAANNGTEFLIDDGLAKVKSGLTTIDEIMKIAADT